MCDRVRRPEGGLILIILFRILITSVVILAVDS